MHFLFWSYDLLNFELFINPFDFKLFEKTVPNFWFLKDVNLYENTVNVNSTGNDY